MRNGIVVPAVLCILLLASAVSVAAVNIEVWHPWPGHNQSVYNKLVDQFIESNPDIKVNSMLLSTTEIDAKVVTALAAGSAPHVVWGFPKLMQLVTGNLLALDPYFERDPQFDTADIYPGYWEAATVDGKIYGVPIEANVVAMLYNKDLFAQGGIVEPDDDWTWNEMKDMAIKLTRDTSGDSVPEQWGVFTHLEGSDPWVWLLWARANGGDILNDEGTQSVINEGPVAETLNFFLDLIYESQCMPRRYPSQGFAQGGIAIQQDGPWTLSHYEQAGVNLGSVIHPIPPDPDAEGKDPHNTMLLIAHLYGINHSPQENEATYNFLKWFTSTDVNATWALETGYTPVRKSAFETDAYQEYMAKRPGFEGFVRALPYGKARPFWLPYWVEIATVVQETIPRILDRDIAVNSAIIDLDRRINAIIQAAAQ